MSTGGKQSVTGRIMLGVLGGGGLTATNILVSFVLIRLALEFLSVELAGVWFLFLSIGAYVAYFDLGVSPTLSREIGFAIGRGGGGATREISDLVRTCLRIFQVLAAAVFVLGLVLGGLFLLNVAPAESRSVTRAAWAVFMVGAALNLLGGAAFAALYGMGDVATERVIRSVSLLLGLALGAAALYMGFGIVGLAAAWAVQNVIARISGWVALYRRHPELRGAGGKANMASFRKIAMPSLKWAAMGLGAILILQTDNPIIASMMGVSFVPRYEAAQKIVMTLMTFSLLAVTSSTPFFSKAYAAGDTEAFNSLLSRNLRFGMSIMVVLVSFLAMFGDRVINLWLGPGNFVGYEVLWTLLVMLTLETHHVIHATAAMAAGYVVFLRAAILAGVLKVTVSILLVPHYGLWGAALGTTFAQLLTNNWYAPYVSLKVFGIPFMSYARSVVLPVVGLLVAMLACNLAMRHLLERLSDAGSVSLALTVSLAVGAALTLSFVFTSQERRLVLGKVFGKAEAS